MLFSCLINKYFVFYLFKIKLRQLVLFITHLVEMQILFNVIVFPAVLYNILVSLAIIIGIFNSMRYLYTTLYKKTGFWLYT